jgi:hypothetical protein
MVRIQSVISAPPDLKLFFPDDDRPHLVVGFALVAESATVEPLYLDGYRVGVAVGADVMPSGAVHGYLSARNARRTEAKVQKDVEALVARIEADGPIATQQATSTFSEAAVRRALNTGRIVENQGGQLRLTTEDEAERIAQMPPVKGPSIEDTFAAFSRASQRKIP